MPAGHTGLGISCLSYIDYFKICIVVDDTIMKDPHVLVKLIEENMSKLISEGNALLAKNVTSVGESPSDSATRMNQ